MNKKGVMLLVVCMLLSVYAQAKSVKVRLSAFMKAGHPDSECIQRCLDYCSPYDKKTIIFDVKELMIDRAILLESNTTVRMPDCTIRQKDYTFDNVFRGANVKLGSHDLTVLPEVVEPIHDIRILGNGNSRIIGCEANGTYDHPMFGKQETVGDFYGLRTHQINFSRLDGGEIGGIEFTKTRGWCISFDFGTHLYLHDLVINSQVKNGDGIDFRVGCKHNKVKNVSGETSDDLIACTALGKAEKAVYPDGKYLFPSEGARNMRPALTASDPTALDIEDIIIAHVSNAGTSQAGHGIICLAADGNKIRHIRIKHVQEKEGSTREAFVKVYTGYTSDVSAFKEGDISDLTLDDICSVVAHYTLLSNCKVRSVKVRNVKNTLDETKSIELAYPEGFDVR